MKRQFESYKNQFLDLISTSSINNHQGNFINIIFGDKKS